MRFQLTFTSGKPIYLQLVDQIKTAAAAGSIQPSDPLPPIRALAEDLRVNRNTVAKAYSELENQGIIETIAGKGCFLARNNSPFKKEVRQKILTEAVDAAIVQAHHLQVNAADLVSLVKERLEWYERRSAKHQSSL